MTLFRRLSLTAQLVLVVTLALFTAQAVSLALLYNERRETAISRTVEPAVARLLAHADSAAPDRPERREARPGERGSFRDRVRERLRDGGPPAFAAGRRLPAIEAEIGARLAELGRPASEVHVFPFPDRFGLQEREARRGLGVFARFPEGWQATRTVAPPSRAPQFRGLALQTLLIFALTLIPLIIFARSASRSLGNLGTAAERFRGSEAPAPVEPGGPRDVRALIAAFNAMQTRVSGMMSEKDQMLGAIGHDLRTPLAALRIRVESVDDPAERVAMIESIEHLTQSLDDILSLARLSSVSNPPEPTDIAALIGKAVASQQGAGGTVTYDQPAPISANAYASALRRAAENLIGNAVRYAGSAAVTVQRTEGTIEIIVEDNGPGIAEADMARATDPFVRLESSRNRETGGSGLGLAIVKAVAALHGGKLTLENRSEGGLRAMLAFPA
ncbi:MAG: ATP-binding protein [Pacificimonas sp.]|jgi:signal transduction histidine kinase|nr:ATP-binding protein [Pacificimonas sp.]